MRSTSVVCQLKPMDHEDCEAETPRIPHTVSPLCPRKLNVT